MEGYLLIFAGLFAIVCAIGNWDWFMGARKAEFFVRIFGRNGARIFYILLGSLIAVGGVLSL